MKIKQGKIGRAQNLGTITQIQSGQQTLLGGKIVPVSRNKRLPTAQELIDEVI